MKKICYTITKEDVDRAIAAAEHGEQRSCTCPNAQALSRVTGKSWSVTSRFAVAYGEVEKACKMDEPAQEVVLIFDMGWNRRLLSHFLKWDKASSPQVTDAIKEKVRCDLIGKECSVECPD